MEGPPTLIETQWPGIPTPIDAAVFYDGSYITIHQHFSLNYLNKNQSNAFHIDTSWFSANDKLMLMRRRQLQIQNQME